jgi:hypothetical protein
MSVSFWDYMALLIQWLENSELERLRNVAVMPWLEVLLQYLPRGIEENPRKAMLKIGGLQTEISAEILWINGGSAGH